jgi:parvulin-like peptidyl-prolyl isomerase
MNRKRILAVFILALAGVVFGSAQDVVEEIVAIVNDDIITLSQYKERYDAYYQMMRAQIQGDEFDKQWVNFKPEILNSMITDLLLLQLAKEKQLNVSDQVKLYIENIKKENNIESDEDLRREIERQGTSYEDWIKQMEEGIQKQAVVYSEVDRTIVIDESEVVSYYKAHPEEFTDPEQYKLRGIYLSAEQKSENELDAKKKEVDAKIAAGEDMGPLASAYSDGPGKESEGDLGFFKKGELEKTLEEAVRKLKVGEVTPWIKIKNGWYLLKLEEKKESRLKTFEEVKKDVEEKLFTEKKQAKLNEFLKTLREKSYVKILNPNPLG